MQRLIANVFYVIPTRHPNSPHNGGDAGQGFDVPNGNSNARAVSYPRRRGPGRPARRAPRPTRGSTAVVARGTATTSSARKKYLQYLADLLQRRTTFSLVPTSKPEHMQQHEQTEAEFTRSARRP